MPGLSLPSGDDARIRAFRGHLALGASGFI